MGWWSATIMGGDTPLDYLAVLGKAVGVEFDYDHENTFHGWPFTREALESHLEEVKKSLGKNKYHIYGQVVGATFLWAGAEMPEELKNRVIKDAEADEWAAEGDSERKKYINAFIQAVKSSEPGKRVDVQDEGLFERVGKCLGG